jgi:pleiotropic regulator 1
VIRNFHGHLSAVYCIAQHPKLDVIGTGGRDCTARIWDVRSKTQIFALGGHENTVTSILMQANDPQVITGSADKST